MILLPGFKAPEAAMEPLRQYLRWVGHDARHWGLGTNQGDPERDRDLLVDRLRDQGPVTLVGWSLGGVIARETARVLPDTVSQVLTYGTPTIGGPSYTLAVDHWGPDEAARIAQGIDELDRDDPIRTRITAIYTRNDRVVSWPACIDRRSPHVTHYEVRSTHLGLGVDPDVWQIIAHDLEAA